MSVRRNHTRARAVAVCVLLLLQLSSCGKLPPPYISEPHFNVYTYGETVRFGLGGDSHRFRLLGWSHTEKNYTWTDGVGASLLFSLPRTNREVTLYMRLFPFVHPPELPSQLVRVFANGRKIATWEVDKEDVYTVVIPHDFIRSWSNRANLRQLAIVRLDFYIPNAQFPAFLDTAPDWRRLGVACVSLKMREGAKHKAPNARLNLQRERDGPSYKIGTVVVFGARQNAEWYKGSGWNGAEPAFTWTGKDPAVLKFKIEPPQAPLTLTLKAQGNTLPPRLLAQTTRVYANKQQIAEWKVDEMGEYTAQIPVSIIGPDGLLTIELATENATSPKELGVNTDSRTLGIACYELLLTDSDE